MERLFSPCTRLYDMLESQGRLENFRFNAELLQELSMDVSAQELLSAERAFTFTDLYAMLENINAVVWLTPNAAVWLTPNAAVMPVMGIGIHPWMLMDGSCRWFFKIDGKELFVVAQSPEALSEICDVVLHILAASAVLSIHLNNISSSHGRLISAPTLAHLLEQCQSLKALSLKSLEMDEDQIRVLGAYSRPGLEIELNACDVRTSALAGVLGRNQGPTSLIWCRTHYSDLADGLLGNSRLKILAHHFNREGHKRQILAIASALRENKGLVELDLGHQGRRECDETWYAVCDSLKTHPTLEVLNLSMTNSGATAVPAVAMSWIQTLLDMMKMNVSIHTIHLRDHYLDHALFRRSVLPYLATNRLRPRVRAIQRTLPIPYRAKVLGRALLAARSDANSFWMLLSENTEVAFLSRTTTIAAAASTPTFTTAATSMSTLMATATNRR
jgi:hypothetical protein